MDPTGRSLGGSATALSTAEGLVYLPASQPTAAGDALVATSATTTEWGSAAATSITDGNGNVVQLPTGPPSFGQVIVAVDPQTTVWRYPTVYPLFTATLDMSVGGDEADLDFSIPAGLTLRKITVFFKDVAKGSLGGGSFIGLQLLSAPNTPITTGYNASSLLMTGGQVAQGNYRTDQFPIYNDWSYATNLFYEIQRGTENNLWFGSGVGAVSSFTSAGGGSCDAGAASVVGIRLLATSQGPFTGGLWNAMLEFY